MSDNANKPKSIKRYLPIAALAIITVALMFYFKENRGGNLVEIVDKGKTDLISLYTDNLQPLLFGTDITNEDVFNFAFFQTLPLDKNENNMLKISDEADGSTNYQVIPASYKSDTKNYEYFVHFMAFDEKQKAGLDSLLESYQSELAEAVLTNKENTIAVNHNISLLQKAILSDIASYSQSINKPKISELFGSNFAILDSRETMRLIDEVKRDTSSEYLVIGRDTSFTSRLEFDREKIERMLSKTKNSLPKEIDQDFDVRATPDNRIPPSPHKRPKLDKSNFDSSYTYTYVAPDFNFDQWQMENKSFDSLKIVLTEMRESLKNLSFKFDTDSLKKSLQFEFKSDIDSLENLEFEMNLDGLGEIINRSIDGALNNPADEKYWEDFGVHIESLSTGFIKIKTDSLKKLKEQLKEKDNINL
ncbi:MAG: hypothetical protein U5K00_20280 [Melioribacteraceae bacterium]|nr:hypothetical protein [Melioribacteraceae bacterium]